VLVEDDSSTTTAAAAVVVVVAGLVATSLRTVATATTATEART
jgi:hypothetical protein